MVIRRVQGRPPGQVLLDSDFIDVLPLRLNRDHAPVQGAPDFRWSQHGGRKRAGEQKVLVRRRLVVAIVGGSQHSAGRSQMIGQADARLELVAADQHAVAVVTRTQVEDESPPADAVLQKESQQLAGAAASKAEPRSTANEVEGNEVRVEVGPGGVVEAWVGQAEGELFPHRKILAVDSEPELVRAVLPVQAVETGQGR